MSKNNNKLKTHHHDRNHIDKNCCIHTKKMEFILENLCDKVIRLKKKQQQKIE